MFRSLRARLLIWYTAILALVVAAFGTAVCYLTWRTRLADVDALLRARSAALARALSPNDSGTFDLALPPGSADESTDQTEMPYHAVWSADGRLIDQTAPDLGRGIPTPGARTRGNEREVTIRTPDGVTILVGRSVASQRAELWTLAGGIAAVGLVALGLSLAGGWWLVGRALEPVDRISRTAHAMVQGDFAARIPVERVETELEQLADALNEAFDRLHTSIDRQRQFTADASHELRTPLATVAVETDWALARDRGAAEYRQSLEACQRAAGRMRTVVERLLRLASTESDAGPAATTPVHLD